MRQLRHVLAITVIYLSYVFPFVAPGPLLISAPIVNPPTDFGEGGGGERLIETPLLGFLRHYNIWEIFHL